VVAGHLRALSQSLNESAEKQDRLVRNFRDLTERLDLLEQTVGESADNLDELYEKYQGEHTGIHTAAFATLEDNHTKLSRALDELSGKVNREADTSRESHASKEERLAVLEQFSGESADKHSRHANSIEEVRAELLEACGMVQIQLEAVEQLARTIADEYTQAKVRSRI